MLVYWIRRKKADNYLVLEVLLYNQASAVEGFVRSIVKNNSHIHFIMVDVGSNDDTPKILRRMAEKYNFKFRNNHYLTNGDRLLANDRFGSNTIYYDARGLCGKALLKTSIL